MQMEATGSPKTRRAQQARRVQGQEEFCEADGGDAGAACPGDLSRELGNGAWEKEGLKDS